MTIFCFQHRYGGCLPDCSVHWLGSSLPFFFLALQQQEKVGKGERNVCYGEQLPVYHHCSQMLPTVLHNNKHWHKIKSLPKMSLKIFQIATFPFPVYWWLSLKIFPHFPRQIRGWVGGGWGGWKPLLQMDLELVRQQISSQAKRGGPANNFIFFLVQKRWESDEHMKKKSQF